MAATRARLSWLPMASSLLILLLEGCTGTRTGPSPGGNPDPGAYHLVPVPDGHLLVPFRSQSAPGYRADRWHLFRDGTHHLVAEDVSCMYEVWHLEASPDGRFLAEVSSGEGHPCLQIIDLDRILSRPDTVLDRDHLVLHQIDPYPGAVDFERWEGDRLILSSRMLLTHRVDSYDRVPACLEFRSWQEFSLDPETGRIQGETELTRDPIAHFVGRLDSEDPTDHWIGACAARWFGRTDRLPRLRALRDATEDRDLRRWIDRSIRHLERGTGAE